MNFKSTRNLLDAGCLFLLNFLIEKFYYSVISRIFYSFCSFEEFIIKSVKFNLHNNPEIPLMIGETGME